MRLPYKFMMGGGPPGGGRPPGGPMRGGPGGGHGPMMVGEKAKNFGATLKTLLKYLKPYRIAIVLTIIFSIASTVFAIIGPKLMDEAVNILFTGITGKMMGSGTGIDFSGIAGICLTLLGLYVAGTVFNYIQGWIMTGIAMKMTYKLRQNIAEKVSRLPLKYFDKKTHGEVISLVANDADAIGNTLSMNLSQVVTSITMILGILAMMLWISWAMTLVALVIMPISIILVSIIIKVSQKYFRKNWAYLGHVNGHIEEMFGGHNVVKSYNGEEKSIKQFDELNNELYDAGWKSQFLSTAMMPIMTFISNLGYVGVAMMGGYLTVRGTIQVGDILAFVIYVRNFTQTITQTSNIANQLQTTAAAAERVFTFLEEEEEIPDEAKAVKLGEITGHVTFDKVHFGYDPEKIIINDFSADIKPGQKVAIVGPTGAGKTTLVKLLMRFYDVNSGGIYVDGVDIRKMRRQDLRDMFGMVLQDTWLFNGTIKENIKYGNFEATDEQITTAAKMAYVDAFVHALPHGYDMVLNEETSNVSQGQKQLITIARAFLADPKILILDEATSSVDTRTEVLIQKAMEDLTKDRTAFVIAHRLSTIRNADIILVMRDGDIVEQGTHEKLLKKKGFYASLYYSQFETAPAEN
ncbi:MAG: ABC transporter ATP-binding protein [Dehalococcoidales bacterium]|nr:ABC transporter ATP-binding protein [Dehalococcoidales bacterium]